MDRGDWFHHLLFIPFNQCSVFAASLPGAGWAWGPCLQMQHFFICGLPGALDYAALALRRCGRPDPRRQKRLQAALNLWLRCPGVLFTISLLLVETRIKGPPRLAQAIVALDAVLIGFNSLYYTGRVL